MPAVAVKGTAVDLDVAGFGPLAAIFLSFLIPYRVLFLAISITMLLYVYRSFLLASCSEC